LDQIDVLKIKAIKKEKDMDIVMNDIESRKRAYTEKSTYLEPPSHLTTGTTIYYKWLSKCGPSL
jgi:hypothetical protein